MSKKYIIITENEQLRQLAEQDPASEVYYEKEISNKVKTEGKDFEIVTLLKRLGIPANFSGFDYLVIGINFLLNTKNISEVLITKDLYPYIADQIKEGTVSKVERCIRVAIESRKKVNKELCEIVFGYEIDNKITNSEFIYSVARYLKG